MWSLIFSGSLSGLALGLTGGGGSVIAVPLLLYGVLGISPPKRTKAAASLDTRELPVGYTFSIAS